MADLFVVGVVLLFMFIGYKMGAMKAIISIASYIISIALSLFIYPILSDFLVKTPLYSFLVKVIGENYVANNMPAEDGALAVALRYFGSGVQSITEGIAGAVAQLIISIIAFLIVVIFFKILIRIVGSVLNVFTKLPVIKQFNRLVGAICGGGMGILVLYLAFAIVLVGMPFDKDSKVAQEIDKSFIASEMYENNILLDFLSRGK